MNDDLTFNYDDISYVRRVFSMLYTQLSMHSSIDVPDDAWDYLADLEDKILCMIRERACH